MMDILCKEFFSLYKNNTNIIQLILNTILLFFISIGDLRNRKISNKLMISFYIINIFFFVLSFDFFKVVIKTLCLLYVFVFLFILYMKTNKIGAGDIKLLIGIMISYYFPYSILICLLSVFLALIFILLKRFCYKKKEIGITFSPFVFVVHFIINILYIFDNFLFVN